MGRAGIEPANLGLKVRIHELRRTAANGNELHLARIAAAANGSYMRGLETIIYARFSHALVISLGNAT